MRQVTRKLSLRSCLILRERYLSEGEKKLAYSVFGEALQLEQIRIVAHRWVLKNYAISPNGHISFDIYNWCAEFSKASLAKQRWLIHELNQVGQLQ